MVHILSIHNIGTANDTARSVHDTEVDAMHALARFARGYQIHGYGSPGGTLTTRSGRVNQACYVWHIRAGR